MTWQNFILFIISSFFVSATPGSNMLYAFQTGLNYGFKKTLWVMAGLSVGLLILLLLALLGMGMIATYPLVLTVIKSLGAIYLIYLGFCSYQDKTKIEQSHNNFALTTYQLFQSGIWVSLSNPKAILFFAAFFPKFIDFKAPLLTQYLLLVVAFFVIETFWQLVYAIGGIKLSTWLNTGNRMLYLNRLCGAIFIIIGGVLIYESMA